MTEDPAVSHDGLVRLEVIDLQGQMHTIEVPDDIGLNVMEAIKAAELPIEGTCGGLALCGSCHSYMLSAHTLDPISDQEEESLDKIAILRNNSRLICQIHVDKRIDGLRLQLAPA